MGYPLLRLFRIEIFIIQRLVFVVILLVDSICYYLQDL